MKLIVLAGLPGAGKEEFLSAVREYGYKFVRMGDVVREAHANREEKYKDFTVAQIAAKLREEEGPDVWAKRAIKKAEGDVFVIDGCRSMDEIAMFKKVVSDITIVGIHACPKTRYDRIVKRARDDAPKNYEEFKERDDREIKWGSAETISLSNIMIVNEGTLEEFHDAAKKILKEVCRK